MTLSVFAVLIAAGCGANFLEQTADKETPAALVFEAKRLMNKRQFSEAIVQIEKLPPQKLAERDVIVLRASAYAGRCGLDFINLVEAVQKRSASVSVLALLLRSMRSVASYADCQTAENLMKSAGATGADRDKDENFLTAFIGFAKIGAILAATGNADEDGDGAVDAGFNACTSLTRVEGAEIGASLGLAVDSLVSSGSSLFAGALTDIASFCTTIGGCKTDSAAFSDLERDAIRTAIHSTGSFGLGTQDPQADPTKICITDGT